MTSAIRSAALNFSLVPMEPHLPSPLSFRSSFSWLPLDFSGSCSHTLSPIWHVLLIC